MALPRFSRRTYPCRRGTATVLAQGTWDAWHCHGSRAGYVGCVALPRSPTQFLELCGTATRRTLPSGYHEKINGTQRRQERDVEEYKREFIDFMVESDVLKFGEFTLEKRAQVPVLHERRRLCDRRAAPPARAVLRPRNPRQLRPRLRRGLRTRIQGYPAIGGHDDRPARALRQGGALLLQPQGGQGPRRRPAYCWAATCKDGDRVVMVEDVTTSGKSIDETYPMHHRPRQISRSSASWSRSTAWKSAARA